MYKHKGPASPAEHLKWHQHHHALYEAVVWSLGKQNTSTAGDDSEVYARYALAADLWEWMRSNLGAPGDCDWGEDCLIAAAPWVERAA